MVGIAAAAPVVAVAPVAPVAPVVAVSTIAQGEAVQELKLKHASEPPV